MRNQPASNYFGDSAYSNLPGFAPGNNAEASAVPEILMVTSYPPRECGIATYSQDLVKALKDKFRKSFKVRICALENEYEQFKYPKEVKYILNTKEPRAFKSLANIINLDKRISVVLFQHEFGFYAECPEDFLGLLESVRKTKIMAFHTVLPNVPAEFRDNVNRMAELSDKIIVMTKNAESILNQNYDVDPGKVHVIPHGTHLVPHHDRVALKQKYGLEGRQILSTFGLLSSGKSIETTLEALTEVVRTKPDVLFLVIGKTHPGIIKREGEAYRESLIARVKELGLEDHVRFINQYLPLDQLLDYLQLTDIYLFTSKDPNQAVSGTFAYAMSCGCAIISTPIPHAKEFLSGDAGVMVDFQNPAQLGDAIKKLLFDTELRRNVKINALHRIVPTSWQNAAVAHALLFADARPGLNLSFEHPDVNLDHIKKLTTDFGMLQFSKISQPDRESGYTLDDNSRALIAMCEYFELTKDQSALKYIAIYLDFIAYCQQDDGTFLNYVNYKRIFTQENQNCNLEDSNGRAIWALGYMISDARILPTEFRRKAESIMERAMINIENVHSPRAVAFIIKGLCHYNSSNRSRAVRHLIRTLADRLTQMYLKESSREWLWFEPYLTYANSVLPEALLYAYRETQEDMYRDVAESSFNFLLSQTFTQDNKIKVISNRNWYVRGGERNHFGEQPIDVAYTIFALETFYGVFRDQAYYDKMIRAFEWFLGRNHLNQIVYNPVTGGCYDGLEEHGVNLNQGAESAVSYLLARLCVEKNKQLLKTRTSKSGRLKMLNHAFRA